MLRSNRFFLLGLSFCAWSLACREGRELTRESADRSDAGDGGGAAGGRAGTGGEGVVGAGGSGTGAGGMGAGGRNGTGGAGMSVGVGGTGAGGRGLGGRTGTGGTGVGGSGVGGMGTGGTVVPPAPPFLSASMSIDFGNVEINVASAPLKWTIVNSGGPTTGAVSVTNGDPAQLVITNGCTAALGTNGQCSIMVAFKAGGLGPRGATLVASSGASSISFVATANGLYRFTIVKAGGGTGTVTSSAGGLNCGATCSFLTDGAVMLQARTTNGSSSFFSGWSGGGCTGAERDCVPTYPPTGSISVTATFSAMTANLIFLSSTTTSAALGNTSAYDKICNDDATAAGINDVGGASFTAMVSTSTSLALGRLTNRPQGWVRMDGKPFANTQTLLFGGHQVFNNIRFNELGQLVVAASTMTGTTSDGTLVSMDPANGRTDCDDFTNLAADGGFLGSDSYGGAFGWLDNYYWSCSGATQLTLICMGKTRVAAVAPIVTPGKKIWLSNTPFVVGGTQTPDALCVASRPPGVTGAAALLATTTRSAAAVLNTSANYVRPDGTFVATGAALAGTAGAPFLNGEPLASGIWQSGDGVFRQFPPSKILVWTGQTSLAAVGTAATTCNNWKDPVNGTAVIGTFSTTLGIYWNFGSRSCVNEMNPIYCVESP